MVNEAQDVICSHPWSTRDMYSKTVYIVQWNRCRNNNTYWLNKNTKVTFPSANHKYHPQTATWYELHNTSSGNIDLNMRSFSKASKIPLSSTVHWNRSLFWVARCLKLAEARMLPTGFPKKSWQILRVEWSTVNWFHIWWGEIEPFANNTRKRTGWTTKLVVRSNRQFNHHSEKPAKTTWKKILRKCSSFLRIQKKQQSLLNEDYDWIWNKLLYYQWIIHYSSTPGPHFWPLARSAPRAMFERE